MENSVLLQRLMEAEKDALEIVEMARKERKEMMSNAMNKANEEVQALKQRLEVQFEEEKERQMNGVGSVEKEAEIKADQDVRALMSTYNANKEKAIQMLVDVVTKAD